MYKDLKKIYDERSKCLFSMAISYIVDKGYDTIEQIEITEEQIKEIKGNDFMTDDFILDLVKVSKEIVQLHKIMDAASVVLLEWNLCLQMMMALHM